MRSTDGGCRPTGAGAARPEAGRPVAGDPLGPSRRRNRGPPPPRRPDRGRQSRRGTDRRADRPRHRGRRGRGGAWRPRRRATPRCCASWCATGAPTGSWRSFTRMASCRTTRALCAYSTARPRRDTVESFVAEREAIAIVAAPGGRVVDGEWPASPLLIEIRRAIPRELAEVELPAPARRAAPGLPGRPGERDRLRGEGGRVHPDHRRPGQAVLGLPRLQPRQARGRRRARARRDDDGLAVGLRVPAARALPQELRRGHGPAGRGRPGHGRPARQLRAGVQRQVLRGPRLPRAHQLLGQLQRRR